MGHEIVQKLFRSKSAVAEFPGVSGRDPLKEDEKARRNSRSGAVSALIVKGVARALDGVVEKAKVEHYDDGGRTVITEHRGSRGLRSSGLCLTDDGAVRAVYAPDGLSYGVTYHLAMTTMVEALTQAGEAKDLMEAYGAMLEIWDGLGRRRVADMARDAGFRTAVLRVCDEMYFWLRYRAEATPDPASDRISDAETTFVSKRGPADRVEHINRAAEALNDPKVFEEVLKHGVGGKSGKRKVRQDGGVRADETAFVGWQYGELKGAVLSGDHVLLAGPTGSGKTFCTEEVLRVIERKYVVTKGMEGLEDLDFIGSIIPRGDKREWVDGPLVRALRQAQSEPVTFFLDEITRLPRVHLNLLPALLNREREDGLRAQGIEVKGGGEYYVLELPMVGEAVWAPCDNFQLIAAGNFGRQYATYDLDPAVRRRFTTVLEFDYLAFDEELRLVVSKTGAERSLASLLVKVAAETRRLHANGELPGALDTGSLLVWARKAAQRHATSPEDLLHLAGVTWLDQVAGREHTGAVVEANALAIGDYMESLVA